MYRSASATWVSDEMSANVVPDAKARPLLRGSDADELPLYTQFSDGNKKQSGLQKRLTLSAESVIHLIPAILILCGFILWFNSHPTDKI